MKNTFNRFYEQQQITSEIWSTAYVNFDTNVLLNLFGLSPTSRKAFLSLMETLENRTAVTYHAATEYHRNLDSKIAHQNSLYEDRELLKLIKKEKKRYEEQAQHPFINVPEIVRKLGELTADLNDAWSKNSAAAKQYRKECETLTDEIARIFERKVSENYTPAELVDILERAKARIELGIPPGLADVDKNSNAFGDIIIWFQLLRDYKGENSPLIFVTSDMKKGGWWTLRQNRGHQPNAELVAEMQQHGIEFFLLSSQDFLEGGLVHFGIDIGKDNLEKAREELSSLETQQNQESEILDTRVLTKVMLGSGASVITWGRNQSYWIYDEFYKRLLLVARERGISETSVDSIFDQLEKCDDFSETEILILRNAFACLKLAKQGTGVQEIGQATQTLIEADVILNWFYRNALNSLGDDG